MKTRLTVIMGVFLALAVLAATNGHLIAQESPPEAAGAGMADDAAMMAGDDEMAAQMTKMMEQCMAMMSMMMGMMGGDMSGMEGMEGMPAAATPTP